MTSLLELHPAFLRYERHGDGHLFLPEVVHIEDAQGVLFLCPKCFETNHRLAAYTHAILCWSRERGVPDYAAPGPERWRMKGTGFHDLTLEGPWNIESSAHCGWCGRIVNGEVEEVLSYVH